MKYSASRVCGCLPPEGSADRVRDRWSGGTSGGLPAGPLLFQFLITAARVGLRVPEMDRRVDFLRVPLTRIALQAEKLGKRAAKSTLGVPADCVPHSFRHTFGARLGETGADAFTIMKLMVTAR